MTLKEHRSLIKDTNGIVNDVERRRLYNTIKNHLRRAGVRNLSNKISLIHQFVDLILETQNNKPLFWIDSHLPFCWNNPRDWKNYPYIRLQWGHLQPNNSLIECNQLENLCLQSARCNNHIQSSMPIDDVKELFRGSKTYERIVEVEEKRQFLFQSERWRILCKNLLD
jgi:hypothetical protein